MLKRVKPRPKPEEKPSRAPVLNGPRSERAGLLVDRRVERLTPRLAGMEVRSEAHVVRLGWPGLGLPELAAQVGLGAMEEGVLDFHLNIIK